MPIAVLIAALALGIPCGAQITLNLDHLAKNAKETVEITLDGALLNLAGRLLVAGKPDEAKAKAIVAGLTGVYVRRFEFDRTGAYSSKDLDHIRVQLRGPGWTRVARHTAGLGKDKDAGKTSEFWVRREGGKSTGIAILTAEPRELTFVQILGDIDLDKLGDLSGQFGIPGTQVK